MKKKVIRNQLMLDGFDKNREKHMKKACTSIDYFWLNLYSIGLMSCENNMDETILHCALREGKREMIKLILN